MTIIPIGLGPRCRSSGRRAAAPRPGPGHPSGLAPSSEVVGSTSCIPARVIDELMGHQRSRRGELEGGSRIGARYRHTTPEMAARVVQALDRRLALVLQVAEAITPAELNQSDRVFK